MESFVRKGDKSKDFDDSGCVQDDDSLSRKELESAMEETQEGQRASLLDLSDDVLLCILKLLPPRDLKVLGYTCPRLGRLVLDHTLWTDVTLYQCGVARMRWLSDYALNSSTKSLKLLGLARSAKGCLGYINRSRPMSREDSENFKIMEDSVIIKSATGVDTCRKRTQTEPSREYPIRSNHRDQSHTHIWASSARQLPRFTTSPYWPKEAEGENMSLPADGGCCGPVFTLTPSILTALRTQCQLHTLHLDFVNINCAATDLAKFPRTLKSLSLAGTKCFNMSMDCSLLYKINEVLPELEHINVSDCEWLDPSALIPLSKLPVLKKLEMRFCRKMYEFIAYGSLAARYGFKQLEILDVRGSPLGESEVSPFAYVTTLRELYLSAPRATWASPKNHAHYRDELRGGAYGEIEEWEKEVPYYYKTKRERSPTPEQELFPNAQTEIPKLRPTNIFTVTLSRHRAPIIEHIAPENLQEFLITQNMVAADANENIGPDSVDAPVFNNNRQAPALIRNAPEVVNVVLGSNKADNDEAPVKRQINDNRNDLPKDNDRDVNVKQDGINESEGECSVPLKKRKLNCVNIGASTSKAVENPDNINECISKADEMSMNDGASTSKDAESREERKFVKFQRGQPPVMITNDEFEDDEEKCMGRNNLADFNKPQSQLKSAENFEDMNKPGTSKDTKQIYSISNINSNNLAHKSTDEDVNLPSTSKEGNTKLNPEKEQEPFIKVDKECECFETDFKRSNNRTVSDDIRRAISIEIGNTNSNNNNNRSNEEAVIREQDNQDYDDIEEEILQHRPFRARSRLRMNHFYYSPIVRNVDPTTLITDSCIKMFGLSDNDDVNYVHIGPNGAFFVGRGHENGMKPAKSNLRKLVCNNYRGITNSALDHLATAAPHIKFISFQGTNVTKQGVDEFKSLRPDCTVYYEAFNTW